MKLEMQKFARSLVLVFVVATLFSGSARANNLDGWVLLLEEARDEAQAEASRNAQDQVKYFIAELLSAQFELQAQRILDNESLIPDKEEKVKGVFSRAKERLESAEYLVVLNREVSAAKLSLEQAKAMPDDANWTKRNDFAKSRLEAAQATLKAAKPTPPTPNVPLHSIDQIHTDKLLEIAGDLPKAYDRNKNIAMFVHNSRGRLLTRPPKNVDENDEIVVVIEFATPAGAQAAKAWYFVDVLHPNKPEKLPVGRLYGKVPTIPLAENNKSQEDEDPEDIAQIVGRTLFFPLGRFSSDNQFVQYAIKMHPLRDDNETGIPKPKEEKKAALPEGSVITSSPEDELRAVLASTMAQETPGGASKEVDVGKVADKDPVVLTSVAFPVNELYRYSLSLGPTFSSLENDNYELRTSDGREQIFKTNRGDSGSSLRPDYALFATYYWKERDLRKDVNYERFWEHINPTIGVSVSEPTEHYFYGLNVELIKGLNLSLGTSVRRVRRLNDGLVLGGDKPPGVELTVDRWEDSGYWAVQMDADVLGEFFNFIFKTLTP